MISDFTFNPVIQSGSNFLHFIMALGGNLSFEQQNQFVPPSAALAGSVHADVSRLAENNSTMEEPFIHIAARRPCCLFFFFSPPFLQRCQISACAHFQLKQTAGLVYNISLIILMAWILDNGEQGRR